MVLPRGGPACGCRQELLKARAGSCSCDGLAAFSSSPFSFPRACSLLPLGARAGPGNSISWGSFLQSALNFFSAWCRSGVNSSGGVLDYRVGVLSASPYPILLLIAAVFVVHSLCMWCIIRATWYAICVRFLCNSCTIWYMAVQFVYLYRNRPVAFYT